MDELRKCPFCGVTPPMIDIEDGKYYSIQHFCRPGDFVHIRQRLSRDGVIAAWNRRHSPKPVPLTLEQLKQMHGKWVWADNFPEIDGLTYDFECGRDGWHKIDAENEWIHGVDGGSSFEWMRINHIRVYTTKPEEGTKV